MTKDVGRATVYAAERAAFEGTSYESIVAFEVVCALAQRIENSGWWGRRAVLLMLSRSDADSSCTRRGEPPEVRISAAQMTLATLIHEFAHVLAGVDAGHGNVYRRAHVDLAAWAFGATEGGWLLDAYLSMDLNVGPRTWIEPPAG